MHKLRENEPFRDDKNLTTADIASPSKPSGPQIAQRPGASETRVGEPIQAPKKPAGVSESRDIQPDTRKHDAEPLFPQDELQEYRSRWDKIQTGFVDEPRRAVEDADSLVANVVKRLAEQFANERAKLEQQWDRGDNVNTEDLRQALRRYRTFFDRLLAA